MSADKLKSYRFATEAQWNACQFVQADRDVKRDAVGIRPVSSFGHPGTLFESRGAHAPVVTRAREVLWFDDSCMMHRLSWCNDAPETSVAPLAMARAARVVATSSGLWVAGDSPESLQRYEEDSLARLLTVDLAEARVVDIASDGGHSIFALVERGDGAHQIIRVDPRGNVRDTVDLNDISQATALVYLRRTQRFVVLAGAHPRLHWFSIKGGRALFSLPVAGMRPCFVAHALGSDSSDKVFIAGADSKEFGGRAFVLIFDSEGNSLGVVPLDARDAPVTGIAADRNRLLITGPRGLVRFGVSEVVPDGAGLVRGMLVTPVLDSPDREDKRRWLRVDATASLPEGTTLEISWFASEKPTELPSGDSGSAKQLVADILNNPDLQRGRTVFSGAGDAEDQSAKTTFSAPLFETKERYLRVIVTLTAANGARLPELSELAVLYPGRTLMENLPAIYQREEERPNSFLRALVGVLESTTQGLDARIGSMGSQIHPATATEPWLDFIARWLGVPWDDGLGLEQKQAIVRRGSELANGRGTRAGLETLLECLVPDLIPDQPRRFRVTDATADFGFATIGGGSCAGSSLPAMLGGHTRWRPELDSHAVLGFMRLPCAGQLEDGAWQLVGKVRVDVAATAAERRAWEPWLLNLIKEMVPLTARAELRWVTELSLRTDRLDGTMTIESTPAPHLGTDAITNLARLPERGARLSATGANVGIRLR